MRAGRLRHMVTILARKKNQDGSLPTSPTGQPTGEMEEVDVRPASVEPLRGRERFAAQQVSADVSHTVRMRAPESYDVLPTMQIEHQGRVLEVVAAMDVQERGRELELLCKERLNGQG